MENPVAAAERPEFGERQEVSFEISNLYLPSADLSGDSYSPESAELNEVSVRDEVPSWDIHPSLVEPAVPSRLSPLAAEFVPSAHRAAAGPLDEAQAAGAATDGATAAQPRVKSTLLAKLTKRSRQYTPGFSVALNGSLLAPIEQDRSPEDGTLEVIQPGTRFEAGTSPELRSSETGRNVTTRNIQPERGIRSAHSLEPLNLELMSYAQVPVTGYKRRRSLTGTSSCGPELTRALDWALDHSSLVLEDSRPSERQSRPRKLSKRPRKRIN